MVDGPSRSVRRLAAGAYQVVATVYLAGLVIWLLLGLVPSLADTITPWHRELVSIGEGHGAFSLYARRVIDPDMVPEPLAWVAASYLFSLLNLVLGVLLMAKRPDELVPRLLALAFMGTAATFNDPSHAVFHLLGEPPLIKGFHFAFHVVSGTAYLLAVVLFPAGRLPLRWGSGASTRRLFAGGLTAVVVVICWRSSFIAHPPFFVVFFGALIPVVGIAAQSLHLLDHRDVRSGEQSRLLRAALLPALAVALTWIGGHAAAALGWGGERGVRVASAVDQVFPAVFAVVPVMLFVAILRHHLWDIDLVASRALLMASLLTFVSLVYVGVVACTGVLLRGSGWTALIPLVVVACVAEPLRERCQALCNRLVFGQRMSPREAIRSLVDRFSGVGDVDELTEMTRVVVASTRASHAEIWLVADGELVLLAGHPTGGVAVSRMPLSEPTLEACTAALGPAATWPVSHEGVLLAVISVTPPRGTSLTTKEARLLTDLSHHAGLLVRNAQLTVDLERELNAVSAQAAELQTSRQAVVTAQDRQRRQLERDVHDGAQQQLVALLIMLRGRARRADARASDARVTDARATDARATRDVDDLRAILEESQETLGALARGGAPRVLVESGLEAALRVAAAGVQRVGPAVDVRVSGAWPWSVDADTAVYFCCLEAMQNAVKHAGAKHIHIRLECCGDSLAFAVSDDGSGFDASQAEAGSGLGNLAARLLPLGGRVHVESSPGLGTTVRGELPTPAANRVTRGLLTGASTS